MVAIPHTLTGALFHYCQAMHWGAHGALADVNAMLQVLREQRKRELANSLDGLAESRDRLQVQPCMLEAG